MASKPSAASAKAAWKDDGVPWKTVMKIRPCFAYKVPSSDGHLSLYCEAWGLDSPLFTGDLHCLVKDQWFHLRLLAHDGAIFADSVWLDCSTANNPTPLEAFIDSAKDSSRYFVIKVGDPGPKPKRSVPIGIGFRERTHAFDLNAALRDHIHLTQRTGAHAEESGDDAKETEAAEAKLAAAAQDLSLKEGQRIRVKLNPKKKQGNPLGLADEGEEEEEEEEGKAGKKGREKVGGIALVGKAGSLMLAPPPSLESSVQELEEREKEKKKAGKKKGKKEEPPAPAPPPVIDDEDDFGDFSGA